MSTVTEEVDGSAVRDDYDILELSRKLHLRLKEADYYYGFVASEVARVGDNFRISSELEIEVPSLSKVQWIPRKELPKVYLGGLAHELSHAICYPFMTHMDITYATSFGYLKSRGVKIDLPLFKRVENVVSDIFNELIIYTHDLHGSKNLADLRYYYLYLEQKDVVDELVKNRAYVEASPLDALFLTHNLAFLDVYHRGRSQLPLWRPSWLSEHLYNAIYQLVSSFDILPHIEKVKFGSFAMSVGRAINAGLYDNVDKLYEELKKLVSTGKVKLQPEEFEHIKNMIVTQNRKLSHIEAQYWGYYSVLLAMYRFALEQQYNPGYEGVGETGTVIGAGESSKEKQKPSRLPSTRGGDNKSGEGEREPESRKLPSLRNIDSGDNRPDPAPEDILDDILNVMTKGYRSSLLSPELAEYAVKKLASATLLVRKPGLEAVVTAGEVREPWYRNPRGRLDPYSLLHPSSILEWKVRTPAQMPGHRKTYSPEVNIPDKITIIIDESESTGNFSQVLAPVVSLGTSVYDVERVIGMLLLYNVLRFSDQVPTALVRFSTRTKVEEGTVKDIYNWLKTANEKKLMFELTSIVEAVERAIELHRDGPTNYFLLITDMEISPEQATRIKELIFQHVRKSPVLILGVNKDIPPELVELNKQPRTVVLSVKTANDIAKIKAAVKKLAGLIYA